MNRKCQLGCVTAIMRMEDRTVYIRYSSKRDSLYHNGFTNNLNTRFGVTLITEAKHQVESQKLLYKIAEYNKCISATCPLGVTMRL